MTRVLWFGLLLLSVACQAPVPRAPATRSADLPALRPTAFEAGAPSATPAVEALTVDSYAPAPASSAAEPRARPFQDSDAEPGLMAAEDSGADDGSHSYVGVKAGLMYINRDLAYDDGMNVGLLFGHQFNDQGFAIEAEATVPVVEAEGKSSNLGDLQIFTLGAYGVYRSQGDLYFKGKLGLLYEYLNIDNGRFGVEGDSIGISLGLGGGLRLGDSASAELEYTLVEEDIDFISLGVNFGF